MLLVFVILEGIAQFRRRRAKGRVDGVAGDANQESADGDAKNCCGFHRIKLNNDSLSFTILHIVTELDSRPNRVRKSYGTAHLVGRYPQASELGIRKSCSRLGNDTVDGGVHGSILRLLANHLTNLQLLSHPGRIQRGLEKSVSIILES